MTLILCVVCSGAGAGGQEEGGSGNKEDGVKNILQMLCDNAGIEIEFEDSDGSESETGEGNL